MIVPGDQPATAKPELVLGLEPDEATAPIDFAFKTGTASLHRRAAQPPQIRVVRPYWCDRA